LPAIDNLVKALGLDDAKEVGWDTFLLWVWLCRIWPQIIEAMILVKPATVHTTAIFRQINKNEPHHIMMR
jgi:hypothetical protein